MKGMEKGLSLLLASCALLGMSVSAGCSTKENSKTAENESKTGETSSDAEEVSASEEISAEQKTEASDRTEDQTASEETAADGFYSKVLHLDAGRKYFSPENVKSIIDIAAAAGYNQLELYLSDNQGFRFALNDLTVSTPAGNVYDLTPALGDGYDNGSMYPDYSGKYLTQPEMDEIISYAEKRNIEIVPCIDTPGHMGAILEEFPQFRYEGSQSAVDLGNKEAVDFALAIVEKYAAYFASQGVKYFNIGADEYANDLPDMGFEGLYNKGIYQKFIDYLNTAADIVLSYGMTPRAFNDGIYYNSDTSVSINKAIQVCYWSSGWWGYHLAPAQVIADQGHDVINTHGDYYWILGGAQCTAEKAAAFEDTSFSGGTVSKPAGSMFCIWCDVANADGADEGDGVVQKAADVITAFGNALMESK